MTTGFTANAQIEKLWESSYQLSSDTFQIYGSLLDSSDNQYIYGLQSEKMFLQKRDKNGTILWTLKDNLIGDFVRGDDTVTYPISRSKIQDAKINNGYLYVGGWCHASGVDLTYIAKISLDGDSLWTRISYDHSNFIAGHGYAWLNTEVSLEI